VPHTTPTAIECCDDADECNKGIVPVIIEPSKTPQSGLHLLI